MQDIQAVLSMMVSPCRVVCWGSSSWASRGSLLLSLLFTCASCGEAPPETLEASETGATSSFASGGADSGAAAVGDPGSKSAISVVDAGGGGAVETGSSSEGASQREPGDASAEGSVGAEDTRGHSSGSGGMDSGGEVPAVDGGMGGSSDPEAWTVVEVVPAWEGGVPSGYPPGDWCDVRSRYRTGRCEIYIECDLVYVVAVCERQAYEDYQCVCLDAHAQTEFERTIQGEALEPCVQSIDTCWSSTDEQSGD